MNYDDVKEQYSNLSLIKMPEELRTKINNQLKTASYKRNRFVRFVAHRNTRITLAGVAGIAIVGIGYLSVIHDGEITSSFLLPRFTSAAQVQGSEFVPFKLSQSQRTLIEHVTDQFGKSGELDDKGTKLYIPTLVPRGSKFLENNISATHGMVNIDYNEFTVQCSNRFLGETTKMGNVVVGGRVATWYKNILEGESYPEYNSKPEVSYVLILKIDDTYISFTSNHSDVSKSQIEKIAAHMIPFSTN
jgi:hypothetical protein